MLQTRFIVMVLFLVASFMAPASRSSACEMNKKTEQPASSAGNSHLKKNNTHHKSACCDHASAAHQQKGHCTHDNCTDNSCHPVSIYSLHTVNQLEITSLPAVAADHRIGRNKTQLPSYAYSIWQPPRAG
ncbi:hypothetical protein [Niabella beijingensis]|uniref:hypothetical protein n=1 Tax=Niabella beijingensis TaxID=2872700 RepID=UPI001CBE0DA6|nr:hypothetical protein [Niabella beijingensis]MBZ4187534.1 hypothetical protein [Niabella beijingensis]